MLGSLHNSSRQNSNKSDTKSVKCNGSTTFRLQDIDSGDTNKPAAIVAGVSMLQLHSFHKFLTVLVLKNTNKHMSTLLNYRACALVVTLAMLLYLINCHFINIIIIVYILSLTDLLWSQHSHVVQDIINKSISQSITQSELGFWMLH